MHSSPYPEPPKLHARPGPVLLPLRPRSTSVPPIPTTVQKMAKRYMPITENVTPPISPARAPAMDPETPPPTQRPGRSRGRGKWRAPPSATPGVGTRSQTRQAELDAAEATQAQAARAVWPAKHDPTLQIQCMTRGLHLRDTPEDNFSEIQIVQNRRKPECGLTSSGRYPQPPTRRLLHSTPTRWWWRCGGINPREHGHSGDDPPNGSIFSGTATRGPSLYGCTHDTP